MGRTNQKARTRAALIQAAVELVGEGKPPSMPEAAERALVSVATAYRYFASAEDLWWEASTFSVEVSPAVIEADERIAAAGPDPLLRLEALIRSIGFHMLDDQVTFRRIAKAALDQWLRDLDSPDQERVPNREGRRNAQIDKVVEPLRDVLAPADVDRVAHALGLVVGTESMIALTDGVGLDVPQAKDALLDASRWLLAGALSELSP
jgi:AcrR family transcriptional regulator